jgi:transglutaminase-like putative cysteine protease
MMLKSCFRAARPRRTIKIAAIAAIVCGAVLPGTSARAADTTAPDWLRTAAHETLPEYSKDAVAVVLLDETQTTVKDNGEVENLHRRAVKILRPEGREEYGYAGVEFDNQTKVTSFRGWTITPQGKELAFTEKDASETSLSSFEVFSDTRAKVMRFPEANAGSILGYEYVQKQRPFIFEDSWLIQERIPVHRARFVLQLPAGWEYTTKWFKHEEEKSQDLGNQHVWEVKDLPEIETEPQMPTWRAVAAWVGVKYFPRDPALRAKTTGSWTDIGNWYNGLTQTSRNPSPQIKQKVAELTSGMTDPVQKMRTLTEYVQRQIRYAAIEIGIGGYQPHLAADVFAHQYGDCKDKATLLSSMLHEIGIESYYVIIDTRRGLVRSDYPSINFDHVILAIRLPADLPMGGMFAALNHPTLGKLLFFDPTNEYVPMGYIPSYLQDSYGLVVTPDGGELLNLPLLAPSTNRLLRSAKFTLTDSGDLMGDVQEMRLGGPASEDREQFQAVQPGRRAQIFENFLGSFLNNFTLTGASIGGLDKIDDTLTLKYSFAAHGYAQNAGALLIFRPRVLGEKGWAILSGKPRKYPIQFQEATRQDDVFDIAVPAGYVVDDLPAPTSVSCDYGSYKSEVKFSDGVLHYKRTYEITDLVVPTLKLNQAKDFLEEVSADENSAVALKRASP